LIISTQVLKMQDHLTYFNDKIKTIHTDSVLTDAMIGFYQDLFSYQSRQYDRIMHDSRFPSISDSDTPIAKNGKRILSATDIPDLLLPGLSPLIEIVATRNPGLDLNPLRHALSDDATSLRLVIDAVLDIDTERLTQFAISSKIGPDETAFIIINWLKPFFISLREKADRMPDNTEDLRHCPFCGNLPDMAALVSGMDGKRYLHCSLCENRWAYKRIACAVCGIEDSSMLEYLSSEDDPRHRLDVCAACNGFIKTVRLEKFEDIEGFDLSVENILTAHLDSAALNRGYNKP
jgi:formate dehydrogenase maturation protein FdhE